MSLSNRMSQGSRRNQLNRRLFLWEIALDFLCSYWWICLWGNNLRDFLLRVFEGDLWRDVGGGLGFGWDLLGCWNCRGCWDYGCCWVLWDCWENLSYWRYMGLHLLRNLLDNGFDWNQSTLSICRWHWKHRYLWISCYRLIPCNWRDCINFLRNWNHMCN